MQVAVRILNIGHTEEKEQPDMRHEFDTLQDMLEEISPYITARALARICGINESQMLQYKSGHQKITPRTVALINEKLSIFADELKQLKIKGA